MEPKFLAIQTETQLNNLCKTLGRGKLFFALDLETEGFDPWKDNIIGVGIAFRESESFYIPISHKFDQPFDGEAALDTIRSVVEKNKFCVYNAAFDVEFLRRRARATIDIKNVTDVMLMARAHAIYTSISLATVAETEKLDFKDWKFADFMAEKGMKRGQTLADVSVPEVAEYCGRDVLATLILYGKLYPRVKDTSIYKLESSVLPVSMAIHDNGILIDKEFFRKESERIGGELEALEKLITKQVNEALKSPEIPVEFNLGSPTQMANILYDVLKLDCGKSTPTGKRSTDESQLMALSEKSFFVRNILAHRGMQKCHSSYLSTMGDYCKDDGRIHARFHQAGAVHGRFSSDDPNLQNISNENRWWIYTSEKEKREVRVKVRDGFIVPDGSWFVEFDYSQIEARLAAGVTKDSVLLRAFQEGQDFHSKTGSLMFSVPLSQVTDLQRRIGKTCNFALIYGGSAKTLYEALKSEIPDITMKQAREYHALYLKSYPMMFRNADLIRDQSERDGYVTTVFGRRIPIFAYQSSDEKVRGRGRRQAYNGVVSGSAADILKMSMMKLHKEYEKLGWLKKGLKMILTIHDSLVFEVPGTMDFLEFVRVTADVMYFKKEGFPDIMPTLAIGRRWGGLEKQGKKETMMEFAVRMVGGDSSAAKVEGKTFMLEIPDGAERSTEQLKRFTDFIQANPGVNTVEVKIGGDTIKLPWPTNVSLTSKDKILLMMGGAFYEKTEKTSLVGVLE